MIIWERDGRRVMVSGWRAWVVYAALALLIALAAVVVVSILLGAAVTVGVIVLFGVPLALTLVLLTRLFRPRASREIQIDRRRD